MSSRFRHYGAVAGSLAFVSIFGILGCGGATEPAKTAPDQSAKKPTDTAKPIASTDEKKATDAPTDKPADKPAEKPVDPPAKPAPPRERFALPNVEFMAPENREKVTFAGKELTAEACLLDTSVPDMKDEWFSNALRGMVAAPDGSLYVIDNQKMVRHYIPEPGDTCKLAIDPAFGDKGLLKAPEDPERLFILADGTLVIITWQKFHKFVGGKIETVDCDVDEISSDGKVGFKRFMDEVKVVDIAGGCKETEWKYKGWDGPKPEKGKDPVKYSVQRVLFWEKDYVVHMSLSSDHFIGVHSRDGKLKLKMGKDRDKDKDAKEGEDICWAADFGQCKAGLCVLDSNCRRLTAFDPKKGKMVESIRIGNLLGLTYPWPVALSSAKGITYIGVTNSEIRPENAPKDAKDISHALIFRVKGLN